MYQFSSKPSISPLVIVFVFCPIFIFSSLPTVRSEHQYQIIRSPYENTSQRGGDEGDVCAVALGPTTSKSCPVNCFRPDPVCGVDGVTYWCGCAEARCSGTKVAKTGYCEVGNGGSVPLSAQTLLLVHYVWLIVLAISVLFGLF